MKLLEPWTLGPYALSNRVAMAPMTRNRADEHGVLPDYVAEYYAQRASAGLLITEGTQPSAKGQGIPNTPGMHSDEQEAAWRKVGEAVHERGGVIFCQLMHTGRAGHSSVAPNPEDFVAPSAIAADMLVATADGREVQAETPRALETSEIAEIVESYASAAQRAIDAGLDGIELHAANGYLPHQFLNHGTNQREDEYGGSPENRARFVVEVMSAMAERIGGDRVGIRVSPGGKFNDMRGLDDEETYMALLDGLRGLNLAYLHTLKRRSNSMHEEMRRRWPTTFMVNTGYHGSSEPPALEAELESGSADMVSVGRWFISNPDLIERWRAGAPLTEWDEATFFTSGREGLIDYNFATR
ncbi:alkene reductase [Leucobacter sp. USHLN153]|uniref:alkene reductase n=1 Tax=Leucobacter sp. USHLN153 TaxID=3081268 RepID=UPI00301B36DA